jgi:hypothetical protein
MDTNSGIIKVPWYRNPLVYAVIIIVIIIIALIIYNFLYKPPIIPDNSAKFIAEQSALYKNLSYWGPSSDVIGTTGATGATGTTGSTGGTRIIDPRSQCGIYTFQGFISGNIAIQGHTTTNKSILNACGTTGSSCIGPIPAVNEVCLDADQISAKLQQHTCTDIGTNGIGCRSYDGTRFAVGAVDTFYEPCSLNPCKDTTIGSIATNFQFNPNPGVTLTNAKCIFPVFGTTGTTGSNNLLRIDGDICNLSLHQLWRITRADFIPTSKGFKIDPAGNFAKIQNRETGMCLAPIGATGGTGSTGSTGNAGVINGSLLTFVPCKPNQYPWLLAPPLQISGLTTPQQFVWAPNPVSLVTTADIINYINNIKPLSLVVEGTTAIMRPFAIDAQTQSQYSAQYLDYSLFNLITTASYPF